MNLSLKRLIGVLLVFVFCALMSFAFFSMWFVVGVHVQSRKIEPRIAFWMEHAWTKERNTKSSFEDLTKSIKDSKVTDLYFHVGPLGPNGELPDDLDIPITQLKSLGTRNFAWFGQIRSAIDLDNQQVRQGIVDSARWATDNGFDGIHLDIEPIRHDDEAFFLLLRELDSQLPKIPVSVAMDEWQPNLASKFIGWLFEKDVKSYWTSNQVRKAAEFADQIVVMTYDSKIKNPKLYSWWVEQQTIALSKLIPDDVELFVGIPSYESGESIFPEAENIISGTEGFLKGVQNIRSDIASVDGIAIYSYWEMDENEWSYLKSLNQ